MTTTVAELIARCEFIVAEWDHRDFCGDRREVRDRVELLRGLLVTIHTEQARILNAKLASRSMVMPAASNGKG